MPTITESSALSSVAPESERFQTRAVASMATAHAVHDTYTAFLPPLLPEFIRTLALSRTEAGLLSVFMQMPSLFQPIIGYLADRFSLRWIVILAPAVTTSIMSWLGVAPNYATLAAMLLLVGISSAGLHAVVPVIAGNLSGRNLGRGMAFWMVGGEVGRTLGPLLAVTALRLLGLRGMSWLMVIGLAASIALYFLTRGVAEPRHVAKAITLPWRDVVKHMRAVMIPLVGIIALRSFMTVSVTTFLPTFLTDEGADIWLAGASLSVLQAAGVIGAFLGGSISDRLGRRAVLAISMFGSPALLLLFLGFGGWAHFPLLLGLGFVLLATTPVIMALVQESFPENRALANGVYMALSFVIRSGVVVAVGRLGDLYGLRRAFFVSAVLMLVGLPFLLLLPDGRRSAARHS